MDVKGNETSREGESWGCHSISSVHQHIDSGEKAEKKEQPLGRVSNIYSKKMHLATKKY